MQAKDLLAMHMQCSLVGAHLVYQSQCAACYAKRVCRLPPRVALTAAAVNKLSTAARMRE